MAKQIGINLVDGVSCAIRANDGVHCAYNILNCPPRFRQTAFMVVSQPTITRSARETSSEDSENKQ